MRAEASVTSTRVTFISSSRVMACATLSSVRVSDTAMALPMVSACRFRLVSLEENTMSCTFSTG